MTVIWSAKALRDLGAIRAYLQQVNPPAARRAAQALLMAGESLALFPLRGRAGVAPGTRELVSIPAYVLVYRVVGSHIRIVAIWHGAQDR